MLLWIWTWIYNWRKCHRFFKLSPNKFYNNINLFNPKSAFFLFVQAVNSIGFGRFQILLSVVVGLCWMADSMEMMILSVLPMSMTCQWGIGRYRQALLTTVVFIGKNMLLIWNIYFGVWLRFGLANAINDY